MPPLPLAACGFLLLCLFLFGGKVQGRGSPAYVASAARAFVTAWFVVVLLNLWVRWWSGHAFAGELPPSLVAFGLPVAAAFMVWRRNRPGRP